MANLDQIVDYLASKVSLIGKPLTMSNTNWSSGSCTVQDSSKYLCFLVWAGGSPMFASFNMNGTEVSGYSIAATTTTAQYARTFSASVSGDTWTMNNIRMIGHNAGGNHSSGSASTITWIIGLIPKADI